MKKIYIMCGLAFSGKSTLARKIAERTGNTLIAFDKVWVQKDKEKSVPKNEEGWRYILDGWLNEYAGRLYQGWADGVEIPSVYFEEVSWGPERIAYHCRNKHQTDTFDIVTPLIPSYANRISSNFVQI